MSYYQQQNRYRPSIGQDGNALTMLIAINLIVFVMLAFIKVVYYFSEGNTTEVTGFYAGFFDWVTMPADFHKFLTRPWTFISHMFVHDTRNVWHIIGNLIWLWSFGYILQDLTGNRKLIPIFIYGSLAGALAYLLSINLIPALKQLAPAAHYYGASAGIMAIAFAVTTTAPGYRLFTMLNGGIPVWVITVLYLILDLAMIPDNNPGAYIAHLGGAAMGSVFMVLVRRGNDPGAWMNQLYDWSNDLFNPDRPKKGKVVKSQLFYKSGVQPYKKTPLVTQQKIDEILDKINQKGYSSLTEDEKEVLRKAAKDEN